MSYRVGVSAAALACAFVVASAASPAMAESMDDLIAAAKAEGTLSVIALPRDWCAYGSMIDTFKEKYGIEVNELNPDAGSGDEIEAIKANKGNTGPQAPDVIDVGLSFGPSAKAEGLIQPYKVATWDSIPDEQKDAEGFWYGNYYGVLSFQVNADMVEELPEDWDDLMSEEYRNSVAISGDPRTSNSAIMSVYGAGLSASGGDPDTAADAGLKFFAELNTSGNFVPVGGSAATLAQGSTPIIVRWDYLALADRDTLAGNPNVAIVVPKTGVIAGVYVMAISAYAPHPNAAKLWMEHVYSDEGQNIYLNGYCHPIRFLDMVANNKIPTEVLDKLPAAENYERALFPTLEQQGKAKETITGQWDTVVGAEVQ